MSIKKVTQHPSQNEALIFERSQTGRVGYRLPKLDVEETNLDEILPAELRRSDDLEIVEISGNRCRAANLDSLVGIGDGGTVSIERVMHDNAAQSQPFDCTQNA